MARMMNTSYNFEEASQVVQDFSTFINMLRDECAAMRNVYDSITSSWTGTAQESFTARQQKWDTLFSRYIGMAEEMNALLRSQTEAALPVRNQAERLL